LTDDPCWKEEIMVSILSRSGEARVFALSFLVICWLLTAAAGLCSVGAEPDEYEPDDHHYQAKHLPLNQLPQLHNFHDQGDEDWFALYGSTGKLYCLGTNDPSDPPGKRCNTVFELYDSAGRKVKDPQDEFANTEYTVYGEPEKVYWTCPAEGLYFLRVRQVDPGVFGEDTG
jgi:hypothetical protein